MNKCTSQIKVAHYQKSSVRLAYRLADDEGTIQAGDMLKLTSDPTKHTTTDLRRALRMLGCEYAK